MAKLFYAVLFFALLCCTPACSSVKKDSYSIQLNLTGVADSVKAVLRPVTHDRSQQPLGEISLIHGRGEFKGVVEEPTAVYLMLSNGNGLLPMIIENGEITVSGKIESTPSERNPQSLNYNFSTLQVEGSAQTDLFRRIYAQKDSISHDFYLGKEKYREVSFAHGDARMKKDKARMDSIEATDSFKAMIAYEGEQMHRMDSLYCRMIYDHRDSYMGPVIMLSLYVYFTPSLRPLFEGLSKEAQESTYGQMVKNELYPVGRPGEKLPDFKVINAVGDASTMYQIAASNRLTLIDFWASWCAPCRAEIPNLKKIYEENKEHGLNILSVSIDTQDAAWQKALKSEDMPWINCRDTEGDIAKSCRVRSIPMLVIVDAEGRLVVDNLRGVALANRIKELLSK